MLKTRWCEQGLLGVDAVALFLSCSDLLNWPRELIPQLLRVRSQLPIPFYEESLWLNQEQFCLLDILRAGRTPCDSIDHILPSGLPWG